MVSKNIFAICDIIALVLAFVFVILAVILLISIIVSKVHKNPVKPVRIIVLIASVVCGILSAAGCYAIDVQLRNSDSEVEETDYSDIYDEENDIITLDGVRYVPISAYVYIFDTSDMELIGKYSYTIDYSDLYDDYSALSAFSRMSEVFSSYVIGTEMYDYDVYDVALCRYEDGGYDLIYCDWWGDAYCNEAQIDEYEKYLKDTGEITYVEWSYYYYGGDSEEDYYGDYDGGEIDEITEDVAGLLSKLADADESDDNAETFTFYDDTEYTEISVYAYVADSDNIEVYYSYDIYIIDGIYYLETDYDFDEDTYDLILTCVPLNIDGDIITILEGASL